MAPATPSHLQAAAPFLLTALAILVGAALATLIVWRVRQEYEKIVSRYEKSLNVRVNDVLDKCEELLPPQVALLRENLSVTPAQRTVGIKPAELADMGNW